MSLIACCLSLPFELLWVKMKLVDKMQQNTQSTALPGLLPSGHLTVAGVHPLSRSDVDMSFTFGVFTKKFECSANLISQVPRKRSKSMHAWRSCKWNLWRSCSCVESIKLSDKRAWNFLALTHLELESDQNFYEHKFMKTHARRLEVSFSSGLKCLRYIEDTQSWP